MVLGLFSSSAGLASHISSEPQFPHFQVEKILREQVCERSGPCLNTQLVPLSREGIGLNVHRSSDRFTQSSMASSR